MPRETMKKIAVLLPCYNEEAAIENVVLEFKRILPEATIYVFDNNSKDFTSQNAKRAGAEVRFVKRQGKGAVVNHMFSDVDADIYVMADGDGTYDASAAPKLIEKLISENLDMVCGQRVSSEKAAYRSGHRFGNFALSFAVRKLFGDEFKDLLTGYRVFSKRFAKSFPTMSTGFEIETELAVHSLVLRMPTAEVPTQYFSRVEGSQSKLNTYRDGFRILTRIARLVLEERPLQLFSILFAIVFAFALVLSIPVFVTFFETGLVPRIPTTILITGMILSAFMCLVVGLILNAVTTARKEIRRLTYLNIP
jgi:glycosyltransferase involved in cell wall biosynthesis